MKEEPVVVHDLEDINAPTILASAIVKLSDGMRRLLATGLTTKIICLLLKDATGVPMAHSALILDALPKLAEMYVRPEPKKGKAKK